MDTQRDHTVITEDSDAVDGFSPLFDEEVVEEDQLRCADLEQPVNDSSRKWAIEPPTVSESIWFEA